MDTLAKSPEVVYNGLAEVFAANIQIGQLKKVIPQYEWSEKRFAEEREYFLWWLKNPKLGGRYNFTDQLNAWEAYELIHEPEVIIEDDEEYLPWKVQLEQTMDRKLNTIDMLANYSYESGKGLPAQQ